MSFRRLIPVAFAALPLSGCNLVLLDPVGDVAAQQSNLLIFATCLMLLVIVPVMVMTVVFAFRYRESNREAVYRPDWDHSTRIELVVWAVPLLIIIVLGAVTYVGTHLLDPYRPLGRLNAASPIAEETKPLEVEVVSLDWKWLFIIPEYGVASVNELAIPVDRPVEFNLTSSTVMNTFSVPTMAGMIYTMPGMETKLHGILNAAGTYEGRSAHFSGEGFSQMRFDLIALDDAGFEEWIGKIRQSDGTLDRTRYLELAQPSVRHDIQFFANVEDDLFNLVVNRCVEPGKMCMSEMMAIDERGGLGLAGINNTLPIMDATGALKSLRGGARSRYVAAICTKEDAMAGLKERPSEEVRDRFATVTGIGLTPPRSDWLFGRPNSDIASADPLGSLMAPSSESEL